MNNNQGMTFIELMIVLAILAIIVALAYPAYTDYVREARRGDAQQTMLNMANLQEQFRTNNTTYGTTAQICGSATGCNIDTHNIAVTTNTATDYVITATAQGAQTADKEGATSCTTMTLAADGGKGSTAACWR